MGTRGQVRVISKEFNTPLYLYAHYDANNLFNVVIKSIARDIRWNDHEYLIRIIFSDMIGNGIISRGFGIGTKQHGDIEYLIDVDMNNQMIFEYIRNGDEMKYSKGIEFSSARDGNKPFIIGDA